MEIFDRKTVERVAFTIFSSLFFFCLFTPLAADPVLRGQVAIELETVSFTTLEEPLQPDLDQVRLRALKEASFYFGAMIYGWSFDYEIGEKAREIPELFELEPLGTIEFGDPRMRATDSALREMKFTLWCEYRPDQQQTALLSAWEAGLNRTTQALGQGLMYTTADPEFWVKGRQAALEDAARAAVRAILQGSERNRPKESRGRIALASFPHYFFDAGRWAVSARFIVEINDIIPFAAY